MCARLWTLGAVLWAAAVAAGQAAGADPSSYKLAPGDRIAVTVYGQADLSGEFLIDGAGNLQAPLVGAVAVSRMTVEECRQRITELLADGYVNNPSVSVRLSELRPIYVFGDVRTPGSYPFRFGMSAMSAVALAGGFGATDARQSTTMSEMLAAEERVNVLEGSRRGLRIRIARMEAERDGKATFEAPDSLEGANTAELRALIAREQEQLSAALVTLQQGATLLRLQKPRIQAEMEAMKAQRQSEKRQLELSSARLAEYRSLSKQGLARAPIEMELRRDVARYQGNISRLDAEIARLEVGTGDIDIRLQEASSVHQRRVMAELQDARTRLKEIEDALPSAREALDLRRQHVGLAPTSQVVGLSHRLFLTRKTNDHTEAASVDNETVLEPGDIVEARRAPAQASAAAPEAPPKTQSSQTLGKLP